MDQKPNTSAAATDVQKLLGDLDGGQLELMLSVALSQVAAAVVDNHRVGEVSVKLKIKPIVGSHQVSCEHAVEFKRPTESGIATEKSNRTTVLFVGQYGALSLAQPALPGMRQTEINT